MELIPLNDYVVLEELPKEQGALEIPGTVEEEKSNRARIVDFNTGLVSWGGSGVNYWNTFNRGDVVLFKRHMFEEVEVEGKTQLIGKVENIIGIFKPKMQEVKNEQVA